MDRDASVFRNNYRRQDLMSGGYFDHLDGQLKTEIFSYTDSPRNAFEDLEISELTWDLLNLIHAYDLYVCGDTERDRYLKAKAAFKSKWLNSSTETRIKRIIDKALDELRRELYETYDIEGDDRNGNEQLPEGSGEDDK